MPTSYPGGTDAWNNPTASTLMNTAGYEHHVLHSNAYDAIEAIETELGTDPAGTFTNVKLRLNSIDTQLTGGYVRSPYLTVASVDLQTSNPTAYASADFQCTGTNDQTQINNALKRATRISDGFAGGQGFVGVFLMGGNFFIGHNGISILMYPNTKLMGAGGGTIIRPMFENGYTGGAIQAVNRSVSKCTISDLTIGSLNSIEFQGSGIYLSVDDVGGAYDLASNNDNFNRIQRVLVYQPSRKGIWLQGARGTHVDNCHVQQAREQSLWLDDSSDAKITRVLVNGTLGTEPGFQIGPNAGNAEILGCKAVYRGNGGSNVAAHGFYVATSRVTISNCQAQDNGGYGFYFASCGDMTAVNLLADSNSAQSSTAGGFFFGTGTNGCFTNIHAIDRAQSTLQQMRAMVFSGTTSGLFMGRTDVPAGGTHMVGAPSSGYARIVRNGTTTYSFG